jgi:TPR repeat protein
MIARKADYEPAPEEQLAVGRCYKLLGNEEKAKYWLDRAAKPSETKAAAERDLHKLDAN